MAVLERRKRADVKFPSANDTLTSGITKVTPELPIVKTLRFFGDPDTHTYMTYFETNSLKKSITNADLAYGEHILTFPLGMIEPLGGSLEVTGLCATGIGAPDFGMGSVIASGAAAVISGTSTFEDFMLGTTAGSAFTAATTETKAVSNKNRVHGTSKVIGVNVLDGSATATKLHYNIGQNGDASEVFTFSVKGIVHWRWLGLGLGTGLGI